MNTNRLSVTLHKALNDQMTKEAAASQTYLSYACWASSCGFAGVANFLFRHAQEERNHMMKVLEYILERGAQVSIQPIPAATDNPTTLQSCFEKVLEQEIDNSTSIYKIVKMSFDEQDWATWNFLQWFVREQTEEETMALGLLDKIRISGGDKATGEALYAIDRDLLTEPDDADLAEEKSAINP